MWVGGRTHSVFVQVVDVFICIGYELFVYV